MKKLDKKLAVLLTMVMMVGCLAMFLSMAGCEEEQEILEYNATLYDQPMQWMNPEYLKKNATYDANQTGESLPGTITNIITSQKDFDKAFNEFPPSIDLEKEMLIVYFFTGSIVVNPETGERFFNDRIKNLKVDNGEVCIVIEEEALLEGPTGFPPMQECFVIKMNKVDVTNVKIEWAHI